MLNINDRVDNNKMQPRDSETIDEAAFYRTAVASAHLSVGSSGWQLPI
jgi:hypothetical protein